MRKRIIGLCMLLFILIAPVSAWAELSLQVIETHVNRILDVLRNSLVENYRTQFREILSNKSPEDLLKTLKERVRE